MFMEATPAKQNTFKVTWVPGSCSEHRVQPVHSQVAFLPKKTRAQKRIGCNSEKDRKIVGYRFLGNASFIVCIDLYIVLCSPPFLYSLLLPFPVTAMLPIYSGDLVFFSFVCRSIYMSLRVLFVV